MDKRKTILLIIFFILTSFVFIKIYRVTPEEAFHNFAEKNHLYYTYHIAEADVDENKKIIFWHNQYSKIMATVLHQVCPYHWEVIGKAGYMDYSKESGTMWGILNHNNYYNNSGLHFGFFKEPNRRIKRIYLNEKETTVLKVDETTYLWYLFGNYYDNFDLEIEYIQ